MIRIPTAIERTFDSLRTTYVGRMFLNKKFLNYTWIGVIISLLNVFLLWLLIDIWHISTVISGFLVVVITFLLRYVLFDSYKVL